MKFIAPRSKIHLRNGACADYGEHVMKDNWVVTVSRQYGSGGRYIAKMLAQQLGVPIYDKQIIAMTAQNFGFSKDFVATYEERPINRFYYAFSLGGTDFHSGLSMNDKIFIEQSNIIKEIAAKGPCILVGRCADYVLRDRPDLVKIFIHAQMQRRVERAVQYYGLSEQEAIKAIRKSDRQRKKYHKDYANLDWDCVDNYHLSLDSGRIGADQAVRLIRNYLEML